MYCYLTWSASWLIHLLLTQVYGVRGEWGDLVLDPQLTLDDFRGNTELSVHTQFAQRPLHVTIANPRRLDAGRYRISHIRCGQASLPFTVRPQGGVRMSRRTLQQLPRHAPNPLRITLAPLP